MRGEHHDAHDQRRYRRDQNGAGGHILGLGGQRMKLRRCQIDQKFDRLVRERGEADAGLCRQVRGALWALETASNVSAVLEPLGELHTV